MSDRHGYAQRTRFLPDSVAEFFDRRLAYGGDDVEETDVPLGSNLTSQAVRRRTKDLWR